MYWVRRAAPCANAVAYILTDKFKFGIARYWKYRIITLRCHGNNGLVKHIPVAQFQRAGYPRHQLNEYFQFHLNGVHWNAFKMSDPISLSCRRLWNETENIYNIDFVIYSHDTWIVNTEVDLKVNASTPGYLRSDHPITEIMTGLIASEYECRTIDFLPKRLARILNWFKKVYFAIDYARVRPAINIKLITTVYL